MIDSNWSVDEERKGRDHRAACTNVPILYRHEQSLKTFSRRATETITELLDDRSGKWSSRSYSDKGELFPVIDVVVNGVDLFAS